MRVAVLALPDVQSLDVTGPVEVFAAAARVVAARGGPGPSPYAVSVVAPGGGVIRTSSGLRLVADPLPRGTLDTLLVAGGDGPREAARIPRTRLGARAAPRSGAWRRSARARSCSPGRAARRPPRDHALGLCDALAERYPEVEVDPDPIFVRDGRSATSAGVTAGMDLALALVEEDLGREVALEVARWLVLFLKRPGGQSQFSAGLVRRRGGAATGASRCATCRRGCPTT